MCRQSKLEFQDSNVNLDPGGDFSVQVHDGLMDA